MGRSAFEAIPRALDDNGDPISGAKLFWYLAGTTTASTTYSDKAQTTAQAHPLISDANGFFPQFYVSDGDYKAVIKDASDVTIGEVDNIVQREDANAGKFDNFSDMDANAPASSADGTVFTTPGGAYTCVSSGGDLTLSQGQQVTINTDLGFVTMRQAGATGDFVADDRDAWVACLSAWARTGCNIIWNSGYTYLITAGVDVANDYPSWADDDVETLTARSMTVFAHGAKIKLKEFTGTELLHLIHNPTGTRDPWQYVLWNFSWYGGEIDQNGYNQNGEFHVMLRDGTGTGGANATALAYAADTDSVFGASGRYPINASATASAGDHGAALLRVQGARSVLISGVKTKNRSVDGLWGFDCQYVTFENCHDMDAFPTNDQFTIANVNNGGSGSQHFAWASQKALGSGTMVYNQSGTAIAAGDVITGDTSGTGATVSSVSGTTIYLYDIESGTGFEPNETLTVVGTGSSGTHTVEAFQNNRIPTLMGNNLTTNVGCSAIGFMSTDESQAHGIFTLSNFDFVNMCTATIRCEHVWETHISNGRCHMDHLGADPTKTLSYPTSAAMNFGNNCHSIQVDNVKFHNDKVRTDASSNHDEVLFTNCVWTCDDTDPLISYTTEAVTQVDACDLSTAHYVGCQFICQPFTAGTGYGYAQAVNSGAGVLHACKINGADDGVNGVEDILDCEFENIFDDAVVSLNVTGNKAARVNDTTFQTIGGRGIVVSGGNSSGATVNAVTNANPAACTTSSAHGFSTGDLVTFAVIGSGMTELSEETYQITVTSSTTFTLDGVDSSAYGTFSGTTNVAVLGGKRIANIDGNEFYDIDENCIFCGDVDVEILKIRNNTFSNFGLDTGATDDERAAIAWTISAADVTDQALFSGGNTYIKRHPNTHSEKVVVDTGVEWVVIEPDFHFPVGKFSPTVDAAGTSGALIRDVPRHKDRGSSSAAIPSNASGYTDVLDQDGNKLGESPYYADGTF